MGFPQWEGAAIRRRPKGAPNLGCIRRREGSNQIRGFPLASMKKLILPCLLLSACGPSSPSIVQTGPNTYLASRSSAAGAFTDTSKLKLRTIQDANDFAAKQGKQAVMVSSDERRPVVGGFPSYEYQFRLTDSN